MAPPSIADDVKVDEWPRFCWQMVGGVTQCTLRRTRTVRSGRSYAVQFDKQMLRRLVQGVLKECAIPVDAFEIHETHYRWNIDETKSYL